MNNLTVIILRSQTVKIREVAILKKLRIAALVIVVFFGLMTLEAQACYHHGHKPTPIQANVYVFGENIGESHPVDQIITIDPNEMNDIPIKISVNNPNNFGVRFYKVTIEVFEYEDSFSDAKERIFYKKQCFCYYLDAKCEVSAEFDMSIYDYVDTIKNGYFELSIMIRHTLGHTGIKGYFLITGIVDNGDTPPPSPPPNNDTNDNDIPNNNNSEPIPDEEHPENNTVYNGNNTTDHDNDHETDTTFPESEKSKKPQLYLDITYQNISEDEQFIISVHALTKDREVVEDAIVWLLINGTVYELEKVGLKHTLTFPENFFRPGNYSIVVHGNAKEFTSTTEVIEVEVYPVPEPIPTIIVFAGSMIGFVGTVTIWDMLRHYLRRKEMQRRDSKM